MNDAPWTGPPIKTRSSELRLGRELALKALYSVDMGNFEPPVAWLRCNDAFFADDLSLLIRGESTLMTPLPEGRDPAEVIDQAQRVARHMLDGLWEMRSRIDGVIRGSSKRWKLQRMQPIERNILRIGTFELLKGLIPARDTIYDCVELAKTYGDEPTPRFVNGILDQICQDNHIAL